MNIKVLPLLLPFFLSQVGSFVPNVAEILYERDRDAKTPEQCSIAIAESPDALNLTFTTRLLSPISAYAEVTEVATGETKTYPCTFTRKGVTASSFRDEHGNRIKEKAFYRATLDGLKPDTEYEYVCNVVDRYGTYKSARHAFTSPMSETDRSSYSFIYIADPQANIYDGKAISTTTELAKALVPDAKFMYVAGDLINGSWPNYEEEQWETFFNVPGSTYHNASFSNQMSDFTLAAIQGNHDEETLNGHIAHPSLKTSLGGVDDEQKITYAFSWGKMRFVILNTEWRGREDYAAQKEFVSREVAAAKEADQKVAVCFHRSMYTGGSHISSEDSVERRIQFSSFFASLGVDYVLQGHDHVIARGQVDGQGHKTSLNQRLSDRVYLDHYPDHAPLYFVGGTASTFKAYAATSYSVAAGDPLVKDYAFLDLSSAQKEGTPLNPLGPSSFEGMVSPSFTKVTVGEDYTRFDTYCYSYDVSEDRIAMGPMLYDSYTLTDDIPAEEGRFHNVKSQLLGDSSGKIRAQDKAKEGDTVFFSIENSAEKEVRSLGVSSASGSIPVSKNRFGYTFVMPAEDVRIDVSTKRNGELPLDNDEQTLIGSGDSFSFRYMDADGNPGASGNVTLPLRSFDPSYAAIELTKKATLSEMSSLASLTGEHAVKGGFTLAVNGVEVYRFNTGAFGQVRLNRPYDGSKGYPSDGSTHAYAIDIDGENRPTDYLGGDGLPYFEAKGLSALKEAVKAGENEIRILYYPDGEECHLNLSATINAHSSSLRTQWENAEKEIRALDYDETLYDAAALRLIADKKIEALRTIDAHTLLSPASITRLVEGLRSYIASLPTYADRINRFIASLGEEVDRSLSSDVQDALILYESLSVNGKNLIIGYDKLLTYAALLSEKPSVLTVVSSPTKKYYAIGEKLDLDGLTLKLGYVDGHETALDVRECEVYGFDYSKPGTKIVVVRYEGLFASFALEVLG